MDAPAAVLRHVLADAARGVAFHRLPAVKARVGLSKGEIYKRISQGRFPPQVKLGERASGWDSREIDAWCAERIAERDAQREAA
jgi:prophage regulatory protein